MNRLSYLEDVQHDMVDAGFFPDKKYSQNFLIDDASVQQLVDSAKLTKKDHVLEIGGGTGLVTRAIAATGAKVTSIEIRPELAALLRKKFKDQPNITILEADFLSVDMSKIPFTKIVASPPYAISDDIMFALFQHEFIHASIIWQLEFAEKILSIPGSSEYHPLSVIAQTWYNGELVKKISPRAFYPIPNHFSAILSLDKKSDQAPVKDFTVFLAWLRTLFRFKNKTLWNAIKQLEKNPVKGIDVQACQKAAEELDMLDEKVFLLEPEDFVELFDEFYAK